MRLVKVSDVFDVRYGTSLELLNLESCSKSDPNAVNFVSRTEKNNGVSGIVKKLRDLEPFEAGLITVAGSGNSVLESFVQSSPFYTGFHVFILRPKKELTELEKLFFCYCIRINQYKYSFGRQANKTLKDLLIPEKPPEGWQEHDINRLDNLNKHPLKKEVYNIAPKEWKLFNLKDYFDIGASSDELINDLNEGGKTPYITSSDRNNGISSYVKELPTNPEQTITANRGGSVGYFFFQPYPYKATPVDVRILYPKFTMNRYIGLFLRTVLQLEKYRFNYSRKMGSDRLARLQIKLPSKKGEPDWDYMEAYIKSLPYSASI